MNCSSQSGKPDKNDVYVIRKLLEQIHNYFEYLNCPFYNSELSERDLLLLLIQPSMKRYKLLEWMLDRLEPELEFYLPKYLDNESVTKTNSSRDATDAIAFLKNLGLCYSRVVVPDIIHAKVGPLVQLKFFVRLLRVIRLKSWNKRPVVRKEKMTVPDSNLQKLDSSNFKFVNEEELLNLNESSNPNTFRKVEEIYQFINGKVRHNYAAKIFLQAIESRTDEIQLLKFKEKLYFTLVDRINNNKTDFDQLMLKSSNLSFFDGMVHLIVDEIISPKYKDDCSSVDYTTNELNSYSSFSLKQAFTDSRTSSRCSGDAAISNVDSLLVMKMNQVNEERVVTPVNFAKLFTTSVNIAKNMGCNGDDYPQPKPRYYVAQDSS